MCLPQLNRPGTLLHSRLKGKRQPQPISNVIAPMGGLVSGPFLILLLLVSSFSPLFFSFPPLVLLFLHLIMIFRKLTIAQFSTKGLVKKKQIAWTLSSSCPT